MKPGSYDSWMAASRPVHNNGYVGSAGGTPGLPPSGLPPGPSGLPAGAPGLPPGPPGLPAADPGEPEWDRPVGWHVAYGVLAAMAAILFLLDSGISPVDRWAGLAILAVSCGWYAAVGRRALGSDFSRTGLAYIVVAIPLTIGLFVTAPFGTLLLFMLYPHIWALLSTRRAFIASAVIAVATGIRLVGWPGYSSGWLLSVSTVTVGLFMVSVVIGLWIGRVIRQSKSRGTLITELTATQAELAQVSHRAGVAAERERLARDIHDTLTQGFASILLLLDAAEAEIGPGNEPARGHLRNARRTAQENIAEARAMITTLTPPHLRQTSLPEALRQLVDRLRPQLGSQAGLVITGDPRPLSTDKEVVLLRAAQEALTNVHRHAAASRVDVELVNRPGCVTLLITDDGRGFDPGVPGAGFGLDGMRARVAQVDGTMQVRTAPGKGTSIRIDLATPDTAAVPASAGRRP
jgi:signal transduction histidine kinase